MTEPTPHTEVDSFERYGTSIAFALVVVGFVLRARGLSEYWLNPDEGIYYSTLTRDSLTAFWAEVSANAHPPLFYLVMRWVGLLTWDFVWLRAVSLISGTVAIWAFWLIGLELGGRGRAGVVAGLVSAGLLAINADAIALSQVIRPYMMVLALLALALFQLLRYRSDPSTRSLTLYSTCVVTALLIHYSAALAFACFCVVVAYYALTGIFEAKAWRRLAVAQLLPALVFVGLYVRHVASARESDLMGDALGPNGWLSPWLVTSPAEAWYSFATFQIFHLPPAFLGRAALLLLVALGVALARNRLVATITGAGLSAALSASVLGLYPFGPSRHNTWLVVFTLPILGWLVGHLVARGPRASRSAAAVLVVALVAGTPLERVFGANLTRTNATEEKVIRPLELAPLVVGHMDPDSGPSTILMTDQSYNLLIPLYADQREDARLTPDSTAFVFSYGSRTVVVARQWDWDGWEHVGRTLAAAEPVQRASASPDSTVLVLAGGWGSSLFAELQQIQASGGLLDAVSVMGVDPAGNPLLRMIGIVVDGSAMRDSIR